MYTYVVYGAVSCVHTLEVGDDGVLGQFIFGNEYFAKAQVYSSGLLMLLRRNLFLWYELTTTVRINSMPPCEGANS